MPSSRAALGASLAVVLLLAACAAPSSPSAKPGPTSGVTGDITVYAAASLAQTFADMAEGFEAMHPGVTVTFSFAGSSGLATQIVEGAPADVFASANQAQMDVVSDAHLTASTPVTFATNVLTIIVPLDNPAHVTSFADLANPAVSTVVCAPQVPCGAATTSLEEHFGVDIPAVSEEGSVTGVWGKVASGQADAGLVYVTDVSRSSGDVASIPIDGADIATNRYPIASLSAADSPALAAAFIDYVLSDAGRSMLARAGFGMP